MYDKFILKQKNYRAFFSYKETNS